MMSQNPDETPEPEDRGSQAQDKEFDSGLDYGAFASDEPDYPEDRLDREPTPDESRPGSDETRGAPEPSQPDAASAAPGRGEGPTGTDAPISPPSPPRQEDDGPRSLSEELAAAKSDSPAERADTFPRPSKDTLSGTDEQATTAVPASEGSTTAIPREDQRAAAVPRHQQSSAAPDASRHQGAAQAPAVPATAAPGYTGSNDEITEADIEEEVTKSKRGASRFLTVLIAIFTPVLFLVAAIRLVGTPLFLWITYQRPGFPSDPQGFGLEERMLYGSYGMDFLFNLANYRYLADLTDPDGDPVFTSSGTDLNEVSHMVDVKEVVWLAMIIGMGLLLLTVIFALLLRSWRPGSFARGVFAGAWAMIAILIALVVLAIIDWRMFFAEFHNLFFDGNWAFPEDYTLIRLYPNQFWIDAGIWLGALVLLFSVVALLMTWPTKRRRQRRADRLAEVQDRRRQKLIKELNTASAGR